jgi:glycosyltransferase involved in cell wall biosynthesis
MKALNICLDYSPVYGGVVQSIRDFQKALGGPVLSFDDATEARVTSEIVHYVNETSSFLGKRHLFFSRHAHLQGNQFINLEKPELLVTHSLFRGQCDWTRRQAFARDIPYFAVPHGSLDPWVFSYGRQFKKLWMRGFGNRYFSNASAVIFATERERQKAAEFYEGINTKVVYWPVDKMDISKRVEARLSFRIKWSIPQDAKVLLYLGRYDAMKRPLETIKAFHRAKVEGTHLVLVGGDSGLVKAELDFLVVSLNLVGRVHVIGPIYGEGKEQAFLAADGFISLSYRENFGYTTAEALSAGLPVILSPGNDLSFEFDRNSTGWCLNSDSLDEAIEAIKQFDQADSIALLEMGENGRKWAATNLSFAQFQRRLSDLF